MFIVTHEGAARDAASVHFRPSITKTDLRTFLFDVDSTLCFKNAPVSTTISRLLWFSVNGINVLIANVISYTWAYR